MSIITIITHKPKTSGRSASEEPTTDFDTITEAIAYLQSLPTDELPAGDGTSES